MGCLDVYRTRNNYLKCHIEEECQGAKEVQLIKELRNMSYLRKLTCIWTDIIIFNYDFSIQH